MKTRVITAVVALLVFIPIIYLGGIFLGLLAALLAGVAVYELFRMRGLEVLSFEGILSTIGAVCLAFPLSNYITFIPAKDGSWLAFTLSVFILMGGAVISKNAYSIDEAAFPVIVSLYSGVGFQNMVTARYDSFAMLLYVLCIVWSTDIGAYLFGRKFGKHKLYPAISPNKTIEGALGGVLSAVIITLIFALLKSVVFPYHLIVMLLFTVLFSVFAQFGDLVESAIKRHYGVKDSGNILPGHGGVLDRFDSLIFVFPIMHLFNIF
jgi:phosphatidate cytidylyltransferase